MLPRFFATFLVLALLLIPASLFLPNQVYRHFSQQTPLSPESLNSAYDLAATTAIFNNQQIAIPAYLSQLLTPPAPDISSVLGTTTSDKRIEVDLTQQRIYAYEGDRQVYNYLISSGKWGKTPTGTFNIWIKLRSTKMSGGSKALRTYYYLPNVPYVMYFFNDQIAKSRGFGIHGAYWHNNFGHPMSHGCINMKPEEVANLFYWAQPDLQGKSTIHASADNPGTPVIIYGTAPES